MWFELKRDYCVSQCVYILFVNCGTWNIFRNNCEILKKRRMVIGFFVFFCFNFDCNVLQIVMMRKLLSILPKRTSILDFEISYALCGYVNVTTHHSTQMEFQMCETIAVNAHLINIFCFTLYPLPLALPPTRFHTTQPSLSNVGFKYSKKVILFLYMYMRASN